MNFIKNFEVFGFTCFRTRITYGSGPKRKLVDIKGYIIEISENESKKYPYYSPKGDLDVIEIINNSIFK